MTSQSTLAWTLHLFEKEKGGVGSTGSLVSAAQSVIARGGAVAFVEASLTQNDVLNAYGDHHTVRTVDLQMSDASDRILDVVGSSPPGASIFVNVPGNRLGDVEHVHDLIHYIKEEEPDFPMDVVITWTMGTDAASRSTLDLLLAMSPPGRLLLNLPAWKGGMGEFKHIDGDLMATIKAMGGDVYQMPTLPKHFHELFSVREIALDRMLNQPGLTMGNQFAFKKWQREIVSTLEGLY